MKSIHQSGNLLTGLEVRGVRRWTLFVALALLIGPSLLRLPSFRLASANAKAPLANTHARTAGDQKKLHDVFAKSPMSFEVNQGQADRRFDFLSSGVGYGIFLTPGKAIFALRQPAGFPAKFEKQSITTASTQTAKSPAPAVLTMKLMGANPNSKGSGLELLPGKSNYFIGADSKQWHAGIPHYAKVRYEEIYPGVSLVYYGNQRQLEYDFVLSPGADPKRIRIAFEGARSVRVAENGELAIGVAGGEVRQHRPFIYQESDGTRREIAGRYILLGKREVGITVDEYDRTKPLTIDPVLVYSTYLGGFDNDFGNGIDADPAGNVYVTGITYSADFPAKNALQPFLRGLGNAFVAKFNSSGGLIYNTFLGGSSEDVGFAIAVLPNGETYIAGSTDSNNFPVTSNAFQSLKRGRIDGFVTKLNPAGDSIVYSTYVGGQGDDLANSIVVEPPGNAYVTGETTSFDFPTRGAFQNNLSGPSDAFVIKLNTGGSNLVYGTYLGGNGQEAGFGIAVDGPGNAYVTGLTYSNNFPTKNPVQSSLGGRVDMFITKLNQSGNDLVYSTYFGGTLDDGGFGIGLDGPANAYVSGFTTSTNFPTKNPFQASSGGGDDAVILKLDRDGKLVYSSYLGGAGDDRSFDIAVDKPGNAYLVGRTESINFPVKDAIQAKIGGQQLVSSPDSAMMKSARENARQGQVMAKHNRDAAWPTGDAATQDKGSHLASPPIARDGFVTKVDSDGKVVYSTYLGGRDEEKVFGVAVDNAGNAFVTGLTASGDFPIKNPVQRTLRGVVDAFVAKISDVGNNQTSVSAASYNRGPRTAEEIVASFGTDLAAGTQIATTIPLPTDLATTTVKVIDSAGAERLAPLFFISPTQINYLVPSGTAEGLARVLINRETITVSSETIQMNRVAPGIFSANSNGQGVIAGLALRVKTSGPSAGEQTYEPVARFDTARGLFVPIPIDLGAENNQVYLLIFGTGFRNVTSLANVSATIGGTAAAVAYAGQQGQFVGLDQLNVLVPRSLIGRGEVDIVVTFDGQAANTVKASIK